MHNIAYPALLVTIVTGLGAALTATLLQFGTVAITLVPDSATISVGEEFDVSVVVESPVSVNVFKGDLRFNENVLAVQSITYNTSLADIWAEEPWYSNGAGTLNFIGGTTQPGGFIGEGKLITITFAAIGSGDGSVWIDDARVLQHDGYGTETTVITPIDALFSVPEATSKQSVVYEQSGEKSEIVVVPEKKSTDLNQDGKQNMVDVSMFMVDLAKKNDRSDFNQDGKVTMSDFSILLNAE